MNGTRRKDKQEISSNTNGNITSRTNKPDPFDNPLPVMTVANLPPDHLLVLNKYPVIPRHFLLVTREFKDQSGDLDMADLAAMYGCLEAWGSSEDERDEMTRDNENGSVNEKPLGGLKNDKRQLYAFYNCGEHSGGKKIWSFPP